MNAASIIEAITGAAKNIATYLSQGWAGNIGAAAPALATALAIGLLALAAVVTSKLKKAGAFAKAGAKGNAAKKAITSGIKKTAKSAVKGIKNLLKSGKKLISKSGKFLIEKGKLVIKRLGDIFPKGMKKLNDLTGKILAKFKFKGLEFKLEGKYILIYGIFNPKKLIARLRVKGDIPNPYGKKGGVLHQNKINEIAKDIEARGLTPGYEYRFDTTGGYKDSRFADVVGLDSQGRVAEIHQVGKSTKKYSSPISREKKAIRDIRRADNYNGARIKYHPYDK